MAAQAGMMTEVRFLDQDPGSEPYLTRVLVTKDYLRLDSGEDKGDFVLLDRKSGQVVNVLHDQKLLMRMPNQRLPDTRPIDYKVEEKVIPVKAGTNRIQLYANGKLCVEAVSARTLLPDIAKALAEYKQALAYMQWQTYLNTPAELREACDLVYHVFETSRPFANGLPLEERDYTGRIRQFSGSTRRQFNPSLFRLPKSYVSVSPPAGTVP